MECGRKFSNKKAIKYLNKILRFKTDLEALSYKGLRYSHLFEKEKCYECFDTIFKIEPDYIYGYYYKGLSCIGLNEYSEAIIYFKKVLEIDSDNLEIINEIGRCYFYLEEYDLAFKYFNNVLDKDDTNIPLLLNLSSYFNDLGDYDKSMKYLNKCLKINPNENEAILQMANVYKNKEDYFNALKYINKAIEIDSNMIVFKIVKSLLLAYNNEHELSLQSFKEIDIMNFDDWNLINLYYMDYALALCIMNKHDEALKVYDEYLEKYPKFQMKRL